MHHPRTVLITLLVATIPSVPAASAAAAAPCTVPGTYATIQQAEDDTSCDPIIVGAGSFANVVIDRDVTIDGAGPELTILDSGAIIRIRVQGGSPIVTIRDLTVTGADQSIVNDGELTVENIVSRNNSTCCGGAGIFNSTDATLTVRGSTIRDNDVTSGNGGAINSQFNTTLNIVDSTISGNTATQHGGAIYQTSGTATITNSTLSGNDANANGGAIHTHGNLSLNNVTITDNTADADAAGGGNGGGVFEATGTGGDINSRNSIIAGNSDASAGGEGPDCDAETDPGVASQGYNVIGDITGCGFTPGTGDRTNVDAMLLPLGDYGGPTLTHSPVPGSPAMELVAPGSCTDGAATIATDQRGIPRPIDGDLAGVAECDAGAVEWVPRTLELDAKNKVRKGRKVKLTAEVAPCAGHEGDVVHFMRKAKEIAAIPLDADCKVSKKAKVRKKTAFTARLDPEADHPADSDKEKVKIRKS